MLYLLNMHRFSTMCRSKKSKRTPHEPAKREPHESVVCPFFPSILLGLLCAGEYSSLLLPCRSVHDVSRLDDQHPSYREPWPVRNAFVVFDRLCSHLDLLEPYHLLLFFFSAFSSPDSMYSTELTDVTLSATETSLISPQPSVKLQSLNEAFFYLLRALWVICPFRFSNK